VLEQLGHPRPLAELQIHDPTGNLGQCLIARGHTTMLRGHPAETPEKPGPSAKLLQTQRELSQTRFTVNRAARGHASAVPLDVVGSAGLAPFV
jgi:hypothetical protein